MLSYLFGFFFSSRRRHTRCALVTGVQTCALPISPMTTPYSWSTNYRHPAAWDQEFAPLSLPDMLAASVARKGEAPMLDFMGRRFSYREVADAVARVACGLQRRGLGKGSRIGLFQICRASCRDRVCQFV